MKMKGKSRFYTAIHFFKLLPGTEFHNLKLNAGIKAYFCLFPCLKWFGKTLLSMVKAVQQIVKGSKSLIIEKSKACEDLSHAVESFLVSKSMSHSSRAQWVMLCVISGTEGGWTQVKISYLVCSGILSTVTWTET